MWAADSWQCVFTIAVFLMVWALIAKKWSFIPIGKTPGALFGASLLVIFDVISPNQASASIDVGTLLLLLGLMLILSHLESKGFVSYVASIVIRGNITPVTLLVRISLITAVMAAFVQNDGAALCMSLVTVKICNDHQLPLVPYMIAMATSANIGSVATAIGNPKNMVIYALSGMGFAEFSMQMGPPALASLVLNTFFLFLYYRKTLTKLDVKIGSEAETSDSGAEESDHDNVFYDDDENFINKKIKVMRRLSQVSSFSPDSHINSKERSPNYGSVQNMIRRKTRSSSLTTSQLDSLPSEWITKRKFGGNHPALDVLSKLESRPFMKFPDPKSTYKLGLSSLFDWTTQPDPPKVTHITKNNDIIKTKSKPLMAKYGLWPMNTNVITGLLIVAMYGMFLCGFSAGWSCILCAMFIIVVERKDPSEIFSRVNFNLLLYIIGLFVTIAGVNNTPIANWFWAIVKPMVGKGSPLALSVFGFSLLVLIICLVFTSIPCVLLVSPHINPVDISGPLHHFAWLLLALTVSLSGNVTKFGSLAGTIASDAVAHTEPIGFWEWFCFAFPSTVISVAVSSCILTATTDFSSVSHTKVALVSEMANFNSTAIYTSS